MKICKDRFSLHNLSTNNYIIILLLMSFVRMQVSSAKIPLQTVQKNSLNSEKYLNIYYGIRTFTRTKRSSPGKDLICVQTKRDIIAVRTLILRTSHKMWKESGLFVGSLAVDRIRHWEKTRQNPALAVDVMIEFFSEFDLFLQKFARKHRKILNTRELRPLIFKTRSLKRGMTLLLQKQKPAYTRNDIYFQELFSDRPVNQIPSHIKALLANLSHSVTQLCSDTRSKTENQGYAMKGKK